VPAAAVEEEVARIQRAARRLEWALSAVAAGALAFSTVTVGALAIAHGVPALIAWMLEPLVGVALWAGLSSDAVLSRYGRSCGWQARVLRFFTGAATLVTNVWGSVFAIPYAGGLRWDPDATGIVLHAIAPVLLILLAEAAPRYRAAFAEITADLRRQQERENPAGSRPAAGPPAVSDDARIPFVADGGGSNGAVGAQKSQGKRMSHGDREDMARSIVAAEPDISGAELARRLGVRARTGQRILNRLRADEPVGEEHLK